MDRFNRKTKESTWTDPAKAADAAAAPARSSAKAAAAAVADSEWKEAVDAKGRTYYFNATTGQSSWTKPDAALAY